MRVIGKHKISFLVGSCFIICLCTGCGCRNSSGSKPNITQEEAVRENQIKGSELVFCNEEDSIHKEKLPIRNHIDNVAPQSNRRDNYKPKQSEKKKCKITPFIGDNGKEGYKDSETGKVLIESQYDSFLKGIGGSFVSYVVVKKDGRFGVVNLDNKVILPFIYSQIVELGNDYWLVETKERIDSAARKYGIIRISDAKITIPVEYDLLKILTPDSTVFVAYKNGSLGVIDINHRVIVPFEYSVSTGYELRYFSDGFIVYLSDHNKEVCYDLKGNIVDYK